MCGILGVFNFNKKINITKKKFKYALSLLDHRGPDSSSIHSTQNFHLGHTRLSIIDLTKLGQQPMHSNNGKYCISFNGEIYNYLELREELIKKGIKFRSNTDTEVLLEGLSHYGVSFIEKCNGMFAFILIDKINHEVIIARDRLGIKPIYYAKSEQNIFVSSEIRPIRCLNNRFNIISDESLYSYFSFRQPIGENTYFRDILSLEPGSYIRFSKNKFIKKKFYDLLKIKSYNDTNFNHHLTDSVNLMLRSDVKISNLLSGGLDSTVIAYLGSKKADITSYSIGDKSNSYNEFKYSRLVSKNLKLKSKEILYNYRSYLNDLEKLIEIKNQPITIPNEILQYQLCKKIKEDNSSVVLSGCGADEILLGYDKIFSLALVYDIYIKNSINTKNYFKDYFGKNKNQILDIIKDQYTYTNYDIRKKIFDKNFDILKFEKNNDKFFNKFFKKKENFLKQLQIFFLKFHLKGILEREDISSMAASVELRVPYLDHNVVESALNLEINKKLDVKKLILYGNKNFVSKINEYTISKKILRKTYINKIPREVISRKKIGFPVNLNQIIFDKQNKEEIFYTINSNKIKNKKIFDLEYINKLFDKKSEVTDPTNYQKSTSGYIFMIYNICKFILKS